MRHCVLTVIFSVVMAGCGSGGPETATADSSTIKKDSVATTTIRQPNDKEITGAGTITKGEDGAYPMFVVTIDMVDSTQQVFDLDAEASHIDPAMLHSLEGKRVDLYYTVTNEPRLEAMEYMGSSVTASQVPQKDATWRTITGVLSGAEAVTESDAPDEITVTSKDNNPVIFKWYVGELMTKANGQEVTAWYEMRSENTITYLQAAK